MIKKLICTSFVSLLIGLIAYYTKTNRSTQIKLLTIEELQDYDGTHRPELYLSILGQVFDVSSGSKHYGPHGTYNFFIGRDASRNFITGKFTPAEANDQVSDLTPQELLSLQGRYYNAEGKLTRYGKEVRKLIKLAQEKHENEDLQKLKYPPCNVEWNPEKGSRVWCTNKSGGVSRDWVGYPRKLFEPGSKEHRCACSPSTALTSNLKEYENCDSNSPSCYIQE